MRKLLVYWIQITDHGRCDDPRDHIWHTLDRYHYLDIGAGSDKTGIKKIFLMTNEMHSCKLDVLLVLHMKWSCYDSFFANYFCIDIFLQHTFLLLYYFHCLFWLVGCGPSKAPWGDIFWLLFVPIGSIPSNERIVFQLKHHPWPWGNITSYLSFQHL